MNNMELLQQLKDIHLPSNIYMGPIAPGWMIVFILLLGLLSCLIYIWYRKNQRKKTVKFALLKLKMLKNLIAENPKNINIAAEISTLIRRTALLYFPRADIAGLSGNDWLNFLNCSGNTTQFTEETGRMLIDAPYRKNSSLDLMPLISLTQAWLVTISKKNRLAMEK